MDTLAQQHCTTYAGEAPLAGKLLTDLHRAVPEWHVVTYEGTCYLQRDFAFGSFADALAFTDLVGALAKLQAHFPEVLTEWGHVRVRWSTPALRGLHRNDFVMAAKTDVLYMEASSPVVAR